MQTVLKRLENDIVNHHVCFETLNAFAQAYPDNLNELTVHGWTILSRLIIVNRTAAMFWLSLPQVDPNVFNTSGMSPLTLAIDVHDTYIVAALLNKGASPDGGRDPHVDARTTPLTPLAMAVRQEQSDVVRLLLKSGADANLYPGLLTYVVHREYIEYADLLLSYGAKMGDVTDESSPAGIVRNDGCDAMRMVFSKHRHLIAHGKLQDDNITPPKQITSTALPPRSRRSHRPHQVFPIRSTKVLQFNAFPKD